MSPFDAVDGSPPRRQLLLPAFDGGEGFERQLPANCCPSVEPERVADLNRLPAV